MVATAGLFVPVLFDFFADMTLVAMVLSMSYVLFLLYMSFRDQPVIFSVAAFVAFVVLLAQPIPLVLVLIFVFFIIMFGSQLQMLLQFGLFPLTSMFGIHLPGSQGHAELEAQQQLQGIEGKILRGEQASEAEKQMYAQSLAQQEAQQQQMQMMNRRGGSMMR